MKNLKDEMIWKAAKKRVAFKRNLLAYIVVNTFLWAIWFFTGRELAESMIPWPLWPMLGWGVGLTFQYFGAYVFFDKTDAVEKEFEKIKAAK